MYSATKVCARFGGCSVQVLSKFGCTTLESSLSTFMIRYWCGMDAVQYGTGKVQCVNVLLLPTVDTFWISVA